MKTWTNNDGQGEMMRNGLPVTEIKIKIQANAEHRKKCLN